MREENKRAINESSSLSPFLSLACVNTNQPLDGMSECCEHIYNSPFRLEWDEGWIVEIVWFIVQGFIFVYIINVGKKCYYKWE